MKVNGVANYLRTIRAVFNKAIKEGIISADCYPFGKYQIKHEKTINRTLTQAEMRGIINLDLAPGTTIRHRRNLFLLSYCLMGINFSDLLTLTKDSIVDGRIVFRRRKTHKVYSIWLHPKAEEILNHYRTTSTVNGKAFLLPFVTNKGDLSVLKKEILQVVKNTNDYLGKIAKLCEIDKPITTYYARYTWANVARGLGYSKDVIAEGLGHEYGNKVTGIYLDHYSNEVIDEMNKKVIGASFCSTKS
jgi:integrase/recombinase XerD